MRSRYQSGDFGRSVKIIASTGITAYNSLAMTDTNNPHIDWDWVRSELIRSERIAPKSRIADCAAACLKQAESLADIKYVTEEKAVLDNDRRSIRLDKDMSLSSKYLSSSMKGAARLNIFAVTIGKNIEDTATRLMKEGDELKGYLLDRIGSLAAESLAESLEEKLRQHYSGQGFSISMRFSPGYCDWDIEEQFKLDRLVGFIRAGVALTKNCMMIPRKSVSAVVGIGPKGLFSAKRKSPCNICDKNDCSYRG